MTVITVFLPEASTVGTRTRGKAGQRWTDKSKRGSKAESDGSINFEIEEEADEFRVEESKLNIGEENEKENGQELLEITEQTVQVSKMTLSWARADRWLNADKIEESHRRIKKERL